MAPSVTPCHNLRMLCHCRTSVGDRFPKTPDCGLVFAPYLTPAVA
ncbi:hypothetical protein [Trichocoleus sp. FACHB-591]|nr:hypothetical protein [Trichocoleus sp. FACHB-591]